MLLMGPRQLGPATGTCPSCRGGRPAWHRACAQPPSSARARSFSTWRTCVLSGTS